MLTVKNFSKNYNGIPVLAIDGIQFSTGVYWIKGENGSGKTTLFKSLAGLLPHQGDFYFDDAVSLKNNPVEFRKRVNYGEAEPIYPGFLTAKDLILFIAKAKSSPLHQQGEIINQFGIDSFYNNPCDTFSSGMLKKLSIALAFLGIPKVIILDEPLITLDEKARTVLFQLINKALIQETIFIISSHQLIENTSISIKETYTIQNKNLIPT